MKRLVTNLIVSLGLVFVQVSSAAANPARYWKVDIFDPSTATTSRTLKVAYNVFSTLKEDDNYTVELFENNVSKGTQAITHENGDSGAFSINFPATGSYIYQIVATNHDAENQQIGSAEKTVQVNDGPSPTVTTVFTNTGAAGGAGGGAQQVDAVGAGGAGGGVAAAGGDGQVAGAAADDSDGEVTDEAATTEDKNDVLGAEATATGDNKNSRSWLYSVGLLAAVAAGALAYYLLVVRKADT